VQAELNTQLNLYRDDQQVAQEVRPSNRVIDPAIFGPALRAGVPFIFKQ
jgi:hypothetical protein